jgi:hypothetical protein
MKKKYFNLRLSERRLNKLRVYAATHDKTMTQVIEELIDDLPNADSETSYLHPDRDSSHAARSGSGVGLLAEES